MQLVVREAQLSQKKINGVTNLCNICDYACWLADLFVKYSLVLSQLATSALPKAIDIMSQDMSKMRERDC